MFQPSSTDKPAMPTFVVAGADEARADARRFDFADHPRAVSNDADSTMWVHERLTECYND